MDRSLGALTALAALPLLAAVPAAGAGDDPGPPLAGTPVTGSEDGVDPPDLTTGRHLDELPARGGLTYRLPRTAEGSTFHLAAMFVGAGDSVGEGVRIEVGTTPGDQGCGSGGVFRPTLGEPEPVLFTTVSTWTDVDDHRCATAEQLFLTLGAADDPADAGRPVELLVYEEPPLSDYNLDLLPDPEPPTWTTLTPAATPRDLPVGTTPTNAPVVRDGTYAVTLQPGRTAVLAVPLDWDQSLQAQLDARLPAGSPAPDGITIEVVGPLLGTSAVSFTLARPADWRVPRTGRGPLRIGAQSQVVAYANRDSYDATVTTEALAGIHYVVVRWTGTDEAGEEAARLRVPASVTLRTTGEAGDGLPAYTPATGVVGPQAASRLVDGTLREPAAPEPVAEPADDPVVPLGGRGLAAAAIAGGVAVLGLVLLRHRRAHRRHGRHRD
ncbi:MAG TPA: hypothetical protein VM575_11365 [Nocardioides sp.]|nr:hypothetical protein [Nocardioides sp.]